MQKIEAEKVSKQSDANKILEDYEEVRGVHLTREKARGPMSLAPSGNI
jgi:hypothetical protein